MKKLIVTASAILFISLFLSSCTAKKQQCDAYGQLTSTSMEKKNIDSELTQVSETKEVF